YHPAAGGPVGKAGGNRDDRLDVYTPAVPSLLERIAILTGVSAAAAAVLWWGRLPGTWRRGLALLTSVLGLLFLVAALRTEGHREAATTAVVILGPVYGTGQPTAAQGRRYCVITGRVP